ncbi:hypothetical protein JOD45_000788 [Scopulibacillus daqui]|uniref:Uncharacterized protein n=1 Tax=Scopulibacillus daqui TaxID=1469162 RepID=A0ABS2PYE7_9BACL|nr:hypothetical protein [Scopulibacillus daqui]
MTSFPFNITICPDNYHNLFQIINAIFSLFVILIIVTYHDLVYIFSLKIIFYPS